MEKLRRRFPEVLHTIIALNGTVIGDSGNVGTGTGIGIRTCNIFYGPPGTGKSLVAREIARKSDCII
ncbi:hypothetical protein L2E82_04174 [Cichorium intybus]|uniref:Uncharacterized protein n=1 Tax=Cichorium intybus TaxID=13427 RepID=A0ACB9H4N9_CICIN|nr:hypothetical protein L2E82_04174 [Cichorium intybus]